MSVCLAVCLSVCLLVFLYECDSVCLLSVCLPDCLSICLSVSLSVCLSVFLSLCLSVLVCLSFCRFFCQSVSLSVCLSVRQSVCLSFRLPALFVHLIHLCRFSLKLSNSHCLSVCMYLKLSVLSDSLSSFFDFVCHSPYSMIYDTGRDLCSKRENLFVTNMMRLLN